VEGVGAAAKANGAYGFSGGGWDWGWDWDNDGDNDGDGDCFQGCCGARRQSVSLGGVRGWDGRRVRRGVGSHADRQRGHGIDSGWEAEGGVLFFVIFVVVDVVVGPLVIVAIVEGRGSAFREVERDGEGAEDA